MFKSYYGCVHPGCVHLVVTLAGKRTFSVVENGKLIYRLQGRVCASKVKLRVRCLPCCDINFLCEVRAWTWTNLQQSAWGQSGVHETYFWKE